MIVSYHDKETERLSAGFYVKRFEAVARPARMKLNKLKAAAALTDVAGLHGNHFEKLKGSREGQFSIRVNDQWRLCFRWDTAVGGFADVELVDYH